MGQEDYDRPSEDEKTMAGSREEVDGRKQDHISWCIFNMGRNRKTLLPKLSIMQIDEATVP